jgi:hypothetical protein
MDTAIPPGHRPWSRLSVPFTHGATVMARSAIEIENQTGGDPNRYRNVRRGRFTGERKAANRIERDRYFLVPNTFHIRIGTVGAPSSVLAGAFPIVILAYRPGGGQRRRSLPLTSTGSCHPRYARLAVCRGKDITGLQPNLAQEFWLWQSPVQEISDREVSGQTNKASVPDGTATGDAR